ncbi:YCF48-related protein [Thalassotalea sp. G2M2-11]|uniref:WD40/YVTN/BNR-like repeat-containing protein n=1 Tax=Thalassotalea sp. G2M2-11 TaxID=2787627 RepID=UPI0019D0AF76|nr:YCF48-related protein [Thalassotalea sp. G2M2-11]
MRVMIGILLAIGFLSPLSAQTDTKAAIMSKLAVKSMLFDIANVENEFVITVGERGHILRSKDGNNWQQVNVPSQTTLTAITFVDNRHGWAVGHGSTILHTNDGGFTWQIQQYLPETQKPLLDVAFQNNLEGIAVGSYGLFYRTVDGGKTWQREYHTSLLAQEDLDYLDMLRQEDEQAYLEERASILPHFNRIFVDGITTYLVGELGLIAKSNDFGRNWQRFAEVYHGSFYDIGRTHLGNLLAVGLRGNIYRSVTNGAEWQNSDSAVTALLNSIVLAGQSQIFLLGNSGVMLESTDDGKSFTQHIQEDGKALLAGVVFNKQLVIASEAGIKALKVVK